jgi:hypothetical protein
MIQKITFAKNRNFGGIRIDAITTAQELLGVIYNPRGGHGYFINNKLVKPGHGKNKYFNDFATLISEAVKYKK